MTVRRQRGRPEKPQLMEALDMEPERRGADGGGEFRGCLAWAAEGEPGAGDDRRRVPQLPCRGDLEAVGLPGDGAQHRRVGVGLDRVAELYLVR